MIVIIKNKPQQKNSPEEEYFNEGNDGQINMSRQERYDKHLASLKDKNNKGNPTEQKEEWETMYT